MTQSARIREYYFRQKIRMQGGRYFHSKHAEKSKRSRSFQELFVSSRYLNWLLRYGTWKFTVRDAPGIWMTTEILGIDLTYFFSWKRASREYYCCRKCQPRACVTDQRAGVPSLGQVRKKHMSEKVDRESETRIVKYRKLRFASNGDISATKSDIERKRTAPQRVWFNAWKVLVPIFYSRYMIVYCLAKEII